MNHSGGVITGFVESPEWLSFITRQNVKINKKKTE